MGKSIPIIGSINVSLKYKGVEEELLHLVVDWNGPEQLGCLKGVQFSVNNEACPKFFKPRPVPFVLREKVEAELERLVAS